MENMHICVGCSKNRKFVKQNYRGSLPNATFGTEEKSHKPNFALSAKYLANNETH